MAEDKKTIADMSDEKTTERIAILLAGLLLLGAIATSILNFLEGLNSGPLDTIWEKILAYFFENIWPIWKFLAVILSLLALAGIVYSLKRLTSINIEERAIYNPPLGPTISPEGETSEDPNKARWEKIVEHSRSENHSDWQSAIIEADIMLEEAFRERGYEGDTLGEILKSVTSNDLATIDDAWEAHKTRNNIAHMSKDDFQLNERETRHIITLFENVFKEFGVI